MLPVPNKENIESFIRNPCFDYILDDMRARTEEFTKQLCVCELAEVQKIQGVIAGVGCAIMSLENLLSLRRVRDVMEGQKDAT